MDNTQSPSLPNSETKPSLSRQGRLAALFLIVAGSLVIILTAAWAIQSRNAPSDLPQVGRSISDINLPDLDGRMVQLSDFRGRPVLINFWASWCPPCRREMPDLEAFSWEHEEEGLVVLAINSGESRETAAEFAEAFGLSFTVLLDEDFAVSDQWMINNLPTSILIGRDGLVKVVHVGLFTAEQMDEELIPHMSN